MSCFVRLSWWEPLLKVLLQCMDFRSLFKKLLVRIAKKASCSFLELNPKRATLGRLMERKNDRDAETVMPAIQAQIKALTRWGTDPITLNLAEMRQPVLIVQGSNDEMMQSRTTSQQLFEQIPNAVLVVYPDTGHGMFFEYPEMFVNQANFFLDHFE